MCFALISKKIITVSQFETGTYVRKGRLMYQITHAVILTGYVYYRS